MADFFDKIISNLKKDYPNDSLAKAFKKTYEYYDDEYMWECPSAYGMYSIPQEANHFLTLLPFNLTQGNIPIFLFPDNSTLEWSEAGGCDCGFLHLDYKWFNR